MYILNKKALVLPILTLILIIGAILRFYRLLEVPSGFMQDELAAGYDAYSLLQTGKDHHGASWPLTFQTFNDWTGHSFNYQILPFIKLWGLNDFVLRFPVAFLSFLTIPLIYFLGKELVRDKIIPILMAFLFSFSQFAVTSSRWAVQPHTVVFFVTASLYTFFAGLNRPNVRKFTWLISGILLGLSLYAYPSVEGFLPIWLLGTGFILFLRKNKNQKSIHIWELLIILLPFLIIATPLVVDHLRKPQTLTIKLSMISVGNSSQPQANYLKNYFSYLLPSPLFLPADPNPVRAIPGFGYENIILGIFYYLGILLLIFAGRTLEEKYRLDKSKKYIILWYWVSFPLIPSLITPSGNFQRAIYILPILIFLGSLGTVVIFKKIKQISSSLPYNLYFGSIIIVISIYLIQQYNFYSFYFGPTYQAYTEWYFQFGMEEVINFTSNNGYKYQRIIIDNTINMPYIYVLFYEKIDPKTLNYQDLAEVDPQTQWLSVKKLGPYRFQKVTQEDLTGAKLIKEIYNSPFSKYAIYQKGEELIVRFEIKKSSIL